MPQEPILIVDDNLTNLKLLNFVLVSQGYEVRTAHDAESARELLGEWMPRLILLDLQLPGISGLEFTREIRASSRTRDILIIAVTAYAMKGDDRVALEAGCDAYLSKPIDTRTLPSVVRGLLNARHSRSVPKDGDPT